ncbi:MAG: polyphenol oxidase family protein [Rickettsiaceae bacterium]|nr:polyphenol oxidase family protein [Rickettsiaceae bacterium]
MSQSQSTQAFSFEIIPEKVEIKIYDRYFTRSTHNYLLKDADISEVQSNQLAISRDNNALGLCVLQQNHTNIVTEAQVPWEIGKEPIADGMISEANNLVLGVLTADCVPVLLASIDGEVIGALHCGWRSIFEGIIENYISISRTKTKSKIIAFIGPSIQKSSYEVGEEFVNKWLLKSEEFAPFFEEIISHDSNEGKFYCDLPSIARIILQNNDVEIAFHVKEDTYTNPAKYPSFRYSMKNNLGKYKGSILSAITKKCL